MFEKAADDADDADVFADAGQTGANPAVAADDQVDADARLAGFVELADQRAVFQAVHLGDDRAGVSLHGVGDLVVDQFDEALAHVDRRDEQLAVLSLAAVAGQEVEHIHDVGADVRVAAKEAQVGIERAVLGL